MIISEYSNAINIAAYIVCEPEETSIPFIPSWYNVWESHMLRLSLKKLGSTNWSFKRYGINKNIYLREGLRKSNFRPYLYAIEHAFDLAFSQLSHKEKFQLRKEKNGLIYIDSWGELSPFENIDSLRDIFSLNIIPRNILKKYNIKEISCKVRGERNALLSSLLLAQDLINNNIVNNVFICGGFRAIPILSFTEIDRQPLTLSLMKGKNKTINSVERVLCIILSKKNISNTYFSVNRFFSLPKNKKYAIKTLLKNWNECINKNTKAIYSTSLPTYEYNEILNKTLKNIRKDIAYYSLNKLYGDSGFITPALILNHLDYIKSHLSHHLLTTFDGDRGVWFLDCWKQ
ncbi:ATP-binding protein [Proteus myxofaciens]|uniref:Uncharacterized protein n=1 Tax=Proteus myxofaciens ATCC 19692 TaxID=1354337 RepID=A0A198G0M4_9GAMM|nr:ATP-binding protein [Proteus myxofaciens]OAT30500.1 hypothetical protein M983_1506 [Proteus myxofaciens ATCC 19692]